MDELIVDLELFNKNTKILVRTVTLGHDSVLLIEPTEEGNFKIQSSNLYQDEIPVVLRGIADVLENGD